MGLRLSWSVKTQCKTIIYLFQGLPSPALSLTLMAMRMCNVSLLNAEVVFTMFTGKND